MLSEIDDEGISEKDMFTEIKVYLKELNAKVKISYTNL